MHDLLKRVGKSLLISIWFAILTFPLLTVKVSARIQDINFLWERAVLLMIVVFFLALFWLWYFQDRAADGKGHISFPAAQKIGSAWSKVRKIFSVDSKARKIILGLALIALAGWPLQGAELYQITIFTSAFIYIMLALGLNIVVGVAGQLVLGYAAFFAIGAYTYGLFYHYLSWSFWICLPIAGFFTTIAGLLLGFPVLRLRGDYLAIVTLGFGEITRLLLTNLSDFTRGSQGIRGIPQPGLGLFGVELNSDQKATLLYYLTLAAAILTIIVVKRIRDSRIGIGLQAMREDEIAGEAMGIDPSKSKLIAFALSACWAGFAGVFSAARVQFISPTSFNFMESAMILSMVVLGGMGSIAGVAIAALVLTLLPEFLRAFSEYRMLIFGALMVIMMIFRPQGLMPPGKRNYHISALARGQDQPQKAEGEHA